MTQYKIETLDWDHLVPLETQAVQVPGDTLRLYRRRSFAEMERRGFVGAENSFSRYALSVDAGNGPVGVPAFVMTAFRHRCALVRAESPLTGFGELAGKTIGLNGWPNSGDVWTRAILRREGVALSDIRWVVAPTNPSEPNAARRASATGALPDYVRVGDEGENLEDDLLNGVVDAIFVPWWPERSLVEPLPIRHLVADYRKAEEAYYSDTGYIPGIHIVALEPDAVDQDPTLPGTVLRALEDSKQAWQDRRILVGDTTPWQLEDLERTVSLVGRDWYPYGLRRNLSMIDAFCDELHQQGLTRRRLTPEELFPRFTGDDDLA